MSTCTQGIRLIISFCCIILGIKGALHYIAYIILRAQYSTQVYIQLKYLLGNLFRCDDHTHTTVQLKYSYINGIHRVGLEELQGS